MILMGLDFTTQDFKCDLHRKGCITPGNHLIAKKVEEHTTVSSERNQAGVDNFKPLRQNLDLKLNQDPKVSRNRQKPSVDDLKLKKWALNLRTLPYSFSATDHVKTRSSTHERKSCQWFLLVSSLERSS